MNIIRMVCIVFQLLLMGFCIWMTLAAIGHNDWGMAISFFVVAIGCMTTGLQLVKSI